MKKHGGKMIAPIIISILFVAYYVFFFAIILAMTDMSALAKFLMGVIPLALAGCMVYVLVERIKEIRSGEEDDLSKY